MGVAYFSFTTSQFSKYLSEDPFVGARLIKVPSYVHVSLGLTSSLEEAFAFDIFIMLVCLVFIVLGRCVLDAGNCKLIDT